MGDNSAIEWTDATWNPVRGCRKVSSGCDHCYAERFAERWRGIPGHAYEAGFDPRFVSSQLAVPLRWKRPRMVFVNSQSDLFQGAFSDEEIAAVHGVMAACPQHTFQILTKRGQRLRKWSQWAVDNRDVVERFRHVAEAGRLPEYFAPERVVDLPGWPGYMVTSKGRVLSDRKGPRHALKPMPNQIGGHCRVMLYDKGGREAAERPMVHKLVLTAFDRAPVAGEQGCHIDGDPSNNALWNLRWGTQSSNWDDRRRHGNGRSYHKLTDDAVSSIRAAHASGTSLASLARLHDVSATQIGNIVAKRQWVSSATTPWPIPWVWHGVSVESPEFLERVEDLQHTPAAVRFLSLEPLLADLGTVDLTGIDWVIVGGESGPGARPMRPEWVRSIRDQCAKAGVAFFFKQWGGVLKKKYGRLLDGVTHDAMPTRTA